MADDVARKTVTVGDTTKTGLDRREIFTDASGISSKQDDKQLSEYEYNQLLTQKGNETLLNNRISQTFDGEIETDRTFVLNKDFFLGDIVELQNEYGIQHNARISELIFSDDENGHTVYPSFTVIGQTFKSADGNDVEIQVGTTTLDYSNANWYGASKYVTFPVSFTEKPVVVCAQPFDNLNCIVQAASVSQYGFTMQLAKIDSTGSRDVMWIAAPLNDISIDGCYIQTGTAQVNYGPSPTSKRVSFAKPFEKKPVVLCSQPFDKANCIVKASSVTQYGFDINLAGGIISRTGTRDIMWLALTT